MNWQVPDDWAIPELRKLLDDVLPGNGGLRPLKWITISRVWAANDVAERTEAAAAEAHEAVILLILEDVTQLGQAEQQRLARMRL
jgi:hypothetical protein